MTDIQDVELQLRAVINERDAAHATLATYERSPILRWSRPLRRVVRALRRRRQEPVGGQAATTTAAAPAMRPLPPAPAQAASQQGELYATPQIADDVAACNFYHSMDIPGHGEIVGEWDLRGHVDEYIGAVDVAGRRVLEIGPASGFIAFELERRGADVVSVELPPGAAFDLLSASLVDLHATILPTMHRGYWFAHARFGSNARVHYGDAYHLPPELGDFDIAVLLDVVEHMHDPVGIVASCAARTTQTMVITDLDATALQGARSDRPVLELCPDGERGAVGTWWYLRPQFFEQLLPVFGFDEVVTTFHRQWFVTEQKWLPHFTVVGRRPR